MKKFYCFKEGQELPTWMWRTDHQDRNSMFLNKGVKFIFGVSCIAVRETGKLTKLIPARTGNDVCYVLVKGNLKNCEVCGQNGASGIKMYYDDFLYMHGEGIHYRITDSKVKRLNYPTLERG